MPCTELHQCYLCLVGLELREDLGVDHVQLGLDLVTPDVVDRADLFVEDQVFRRGREPAGEQREPSAPGTSN